jgi:hypothetical protein
MSTTHIEPLHLREQMTILSKKSVQNLLHIIAGRLTKSMEVKTLYTLRQSISKTLGILAKA